MTLNCKHVLLSVANLHLRTSLRCERNEREKKSTENSIHNLLMA